MIRPKGSLISYFSTMVKQHGGINLAQGIPGFNPPKELLDSLAAVAHDNIHQYPPGTGNFSLVQQLIKYYSDQIQLSDKNILILQGATEALSLMFFYVMHKIRGPFTTLSFSPPYESYRQLPIQFGLPFIEVAPDETNGIPLEKVASHIEKDNVKLIYLASPGNPQGLVFSKKDIDAMVELCSRMNCYLIFDSVYRTLYFGEKPYVPLSKLNPWLFVVDGFSKWYSITGWRVGVLMHDESHTGELRSMHDYTGLCTNSVLQEALARYVADNNFGHSYSETIRQNFASNYRFAHHALSQMGFKPSQANGGYFVWAQLPEHFDHGFDFAMQLFEKTNVSIVPGIHFSDNADKFVRFNIARPLPELTEGLDRLQKYLSE